MGVSKGVVRVAAGTNDNVVVTLGGGSGDLARSFEARLDHGDLLPAILDGPVAAHLANDLNLLQEGALVPLLADLRDLAIVAKGHDVDLQRPGGQYATKRTACEGTRRWDLQWADRPRGL